MKHEDVIAWLEYFIDGSLPDEKRFCFVGDTTRRMRAAGISKRVPSAAAGNTQAQGKKQPNTNPSTSSSRGKGAKSAEKAIKDLDKVELDDRETPPPPPPPEDKGDDDDESDPNRAEVIRSSGTRSRPSHTPAGSVDSATHAASIPITSQYGAHSRSPSTALTSELPFPSVTPPPPPPPPPQPSTDDVPSFPHPVPSTPPVTLSFRPKMHTQVGCCDAKPNEVTDLFVPP